MENTTRIWSSKQRLAHYRVILKRNLRKMGIRVGNDTETHTLELLNRVMTRQKQMEHNHD